MTWASWGFTRSRLCPGRWARGSSLLLQAELLARVLGALTPAHLHWAELVCRSFRAVGKCFPHPPCCQGTDSKNGSVGIAWAVGADYTYKK
mgnify:CR=1 FL=1